MKKTINVLALFFLSQMAYAAMPMDLNHQKSESLFHFAGNSDIQLKKISEATDFNNTHHIRYQQTYFGVPVWNAEAVTHGHRAMNGKIYAAIGKDLPKGLFKSSKAIEARALAQLKTAYQQKTGMKQEAFKKEFIKEIIFIDPQNTAHDAFLISFYVDDGRQGAHRPTYIVDAQTINVYRAWDQVKTKEVLGGGIGGNTKTGPIIYDGDLGHLSALNIEEDGNEAFGARCELKNADIKVMDISYAGVTVANECFIFPGLHHDVYWLDMDEDGSRWFEDEINGSYSPSLDAFYDALTIKKFYNDWYGIPPLVEKDGKTPMQMIMRVHYGRSFDNAFWDGEVMTFGDGGNLFYPLTSLDVAAHEIGHGFTDQHSRIDTFESQMSALHESFSDMAAAAIEFYLTKKNTWEVGRAIWKGEGAMRYMDDPKKDGDSIDHIKDFTDDIDPHLGAGVTSKAFYLMATANGWDTKKAFNVWIQANRFYWNSSMKTLQEAACGVISGTKDYGYDLATVQNAFKQVGIDTGSC